MVYRWGKDHEIELYDSIQNLPILRFQKFNKYQMLAADVGNSISDFDARMGKTYEFLQKGMTAEAMQEIMNCRQTVYNNLNEFTPTGKSLAVLVKRINQVRYDNEYAPDDLDRILQHLEAINFDMETTVEKLVEVKKKSISSCPFIFRITSRRTQIQN